MAAITVPIASQHSMLRPLNVLRDLPAVADLVEKCFASTLEPEGRNYLQQMRQAGQDNVFTRWATNAVESVSMPLSGYVWEENGQIIGNVSLIPYRNKKSRIYLIANVAVHPDYRRRGIGRALTNRAMEHANERHAAATWLHVRDDNPGAINLYISLGFEELARRTLWQAKPDRAVSTGSIGIDISRRNPRDWENQKLWLGRVYPELIGWYQTMPWIPLSPGLRSFLYRFFIDSEVRHWVAHHNGAISAILSWSATVDEIDRLWAAVPPEGAEQSLTALLLNARRNLTWHKSLALDFPAGEYCDSIAAAGFHAQRTLIWMKLRQKELVNNL